MHANVYCDRPGPITGMSSIDRSALTPESLTVSMHTASYPSAWACNPDSNSAMSAIT